MFKKIFAIFAYDATRAAITIYTAIQKVFFDVKSMKHKLVELSMVYSEII